MPRLALAAVLVCLPLAVLAGCGSSSGSGDGSGVGDGPHAEISRCYLDANGLPQAEVTLEGADDPHNPTYIAKVSFRIPGLPDNSYWINLTTFTGTAHGTTEVSPIEPLLEGQSPNCLLTELNHDVFKHGQEIGETVWKGESPEMALEP